VSYEVFARKYRPQTFDDLVGQAHVSRTLKNAVAQNRLAHAYLFVGPRGVGKTSTARILAKSLNCVKGPTVTPCGECDNCGEIAAGNSLDVIEIDGASNNSVEDVRQLRENVRYAPAKGRYKIYLIDEVHMLTTHSFNALLKTLEEPPAHVVFILCTTDAQKIPLTVIGRCQQFVFRRHSEEQIAGRLTHIAQVARSGTVRSQNQPPAIIPAGASSCQATSLKPVTRFSVSIQTIPRSSRSSRCCRLSLFIAPRPPLTHGLPPATNQTHRSRTAYCSSLHSSIKASHETARKWPEFRVCPTVRRRRDRYIRPCETVCQAELQAADARYPPFACEIRRFANGGLRGPGPIGFC